MFNEIVFIGLGLIGGSLARKIKQVSPKTTIKAKARSQETIQYALKEKIIDDSTNDLAKLVKDADLVVIATPINKTIDYVKEIYPLVKDSAIIIDVASTKVKIVAALKKFADKFIGGHPMFGAEIFGIKNSDPSMIEGAKFIITPDFQTPKEKLDLLKKFIEDIGMVGMELDPKQHDQEVAAVSHLPYFTAAALLCNVKDKTQKDLAATGFKSTTRVAASDPLWGKEIAEHNKEAIVEQLDNMVGELTVIKDFIEKQDLDSLRSYLENSRAIRMELYP